MALGICGTNLVWAQTNPSSAPTKFYYFGGGGERGDEQNQFDSSFRSMKELSVQKNWESIFQADINHPSTKSQISKLRESSKKNISEFSTENFKTQMAQIVADLESGKLASGQQLLVTIDTHGGLRDASGENNISTSDGETSLSAPIERLIESAKRRGVKLGLILKHCYSGDLRKDFGDTDDVCIITSSAPGRVSTRDFDEFNSSMKSSSNLEEAFLVSRPDQIRSATQPGINTEAGFRAERDLEIFRNYKVYDPDFDSAADDRLCENTPMKLDRLIELGRTLDGNTQRKWSDLLTATNTDVARELKRGLEKLKEQFDRPLERPDTGAYGINDLDCKLKNPSTHVICDAIFRDPELLISLKDSAATMKQYSDELANSPGFSNHFLNNAKSLQGQIRNLEDRRQRPEVVRAQREVARKKVEIAKWEKSQKKFVLSAKNHTLVEHERKLYDALYKHYSKSEKESNACRDFKLK